MFIEYGIKALEMLKNFKEEFVNEYILYRNFKSLLFEKKDVVLGRKLVVDYLKCIKREISQFQDYQITEQTKYIFTVKIS